MEVSVESTSNLGRRLKVSVPDATVATQVDAKMTKLSKEAHLKGFRPGKVPLNVLQKKYGPSIRMEVINDIIREALSDTINKQSIQLAGMPKIEEIKDNNGQNLEFVAFFEVYPEIVLADFTNTPIEKSVVTITDQDVSKMIERLEDQLADWLPCERAVQAGDKLKVNFARTIDVPGATQEEQKNVFMIVGDKGVLPGLSDALIGKHKDDNVKIKTEYPAQWADEKVAGKGVDLSVTILEVTQKQKLSVTELAERLELSENSQAALEKAVRERMQEELDQALRDELKESVLEKLLEKNPIELPQALIEQEKEAIAREISKQRRVNIPLDALNQAELAEQARRRVELGLLLNEVIKFKALTADAKRVRQQIEKIAGRFASQTEEIIDAYYANKDLLGSVERMVLLEQAVDVLLDDAQVSEKTASYEDIMYPAANKE